MPLFVALFRDTCTCINLREGEDVHHILTGAPPDLSLRLPGVLHA